MLALPLSEVHYSNFVKQKKERKEKKRLFDVATIHLARSVHHSLTVQGY